MALTKITLFIDGGCRGNPGPAGGGICALDSTGLILQEASYYLGETTNNVAEYKALIYALEMAHDYHWDEIEICSDSQLLVKQVKGEFKVKAEELKPLYGRAMNLLGRIPDFTLTWIPREKNALADALANLAMDRKQSRYAAPQYQQDASHADELGKILTAHEHLLNQLVADPKRNKLDILNAHWEEVTRAFARLRIHLT